MGKKYINYKNLFSVGWNMEKALIRLCPEITHSSGIYIWIRENEVEKCAYIGQAKDLIRRNISHLMGYKQRIDQSLRKWGLYDEEFNTTGWRLGILHFGIDELNAQEQRLIEAYKEHGYEMYNIESGGTEGKTLINERKLGKGYYEGIERGKKIILDDLNKWFGKYLKAGKMGSGKLAERMLVKFNNLLKGENNEKK